jgi:hypothetical protein
MVNVASKWFKNIKKFIIFIKKIQPHSHSQTERPKALETRLKVFSKYEIIIEKPKL